MYWRRPSELNTYLELIQISMINRLRGINYKLYVLVKEGLAGLIINGG